MNVFIGCDADEISIGSVEEITDNHPSPLRIEGELEGQVNDYADYMMSPMWVRPLAVVIMDMVSDMVANGTEEHHLTLRIR